MRIHHHAILTAAATLALMVMGSLVHGTGSSLACPDWPLCHGSALPTMTNGVEFEHTHRLMAAAVVVLVVALFVRTLRGAAAEERRTCRRLAGAACALVAVQAALGALTVVLRLPPAVSIAHLATSMTFLGVLVVLAARLAPRARAVRADVNRGWRGWTAAAGLLVLAQIVLGGVVRHTGAALACTDVPLCHGSIWPDEWLGRVQMVHRVTGAAALVVVMIASVVAVRRTRSARRHCLALAPAILALSQVALGVSVVLTSAPLDLVTIHHACAALLLASLALVFAYEDHGSRRATSSNRSALSTRSSLAR